MTSVLRLDRLCWSVGGADIIDEVSLAVREGELLAVIGPNGAGKTSLFNLITGLTRPTGGAVLLDGHDITALPPHRRVRRVGAADVAGVLERVRLAHRADDLAAGLSHGDKRKLELAMLLAPTLGAGTAGSRLMLLDEPMAGVASEETAELTDLIRSLHRDEGRTVLLVEHHMEVVLGLADRVAVMHHGRLLAAASPAEVMADATVQQAYLGDEL